MSIQASRARRGMLSLRCAGWYPVSIANGSFADQITNVSDVAILQCFGPGLCNPNSSADYQCSAGRDTRARLCSRCLPGFAPLGSTCLQCTQSARWLASLGAVIVLVLLVV